MASSIVLGPATSSHFPDFPRGKFTAETKVTFVEAGLSNTDVKPIINLLMKDHPFTEKLSGYLDIGQTDPDKDLDVVDSAVMKTIYIDPAYLGSGYGSSGVDAFAASNPPKFFMLRCLAGSGFVYLNVRGDSGGGTPNVVYVPPFPLHANKGVFMYSFPRVDTHYARAQGPMLGEYSTIPIALLSIQLRTFLEGNRFQYYLFR
jgi:hypothetical protein